MQKLSGMVVLGLCMLICLTASCAHAEYKLLWSDEFEAVSINKSNWQHEIYPGVISTAKELQYNTDRAENSFVKDGKLVISVNKEKYEDNEFTSARLNTSGKFDFRYGKIEARVKLPGGNGVRSKLWLLPDSLEYGGWPSSGEVDILNAINTNSYSIRSGIVFRKAFQGNEYAMKEYNQPEGFNPNDYHVYTLEWQPYEMQWSIDGKLYATVNQWASPDVGYPAPFDKPFYLVLAAAVEGKTAQTADFPQQMEVDWIRVYQVGDNKPPQLKINNPKNDAKIDANEAVKINVSASDPDGNIDRVEYYNGDKLIGENKVAPFGFSWDAPDGCYKIIARAVDNKGFVCADSIEIEKGAGCLPEPFHGGPSGIPGKIEAEDFDKSLKGESYYDYDESNNGGVYRQTAVDIQECDEGGFNVGWIVDNEWLLYTVDITEAGIYDIRFRVSSGIDGGELYIEFDGVDKTGKIKTPATGNWQSYVDVIAKQVNLSAGKQVMKVFIDKGGFNLNYMDFTLSK